MAVAPQPSSHAISRATPYPSFPSQLAPLDLQLGEIVAGSLRAAVFATTTSVVESVRQAQAEIAKSLFKRAVKICEDKQLRLETLLLEGSLKEMICQAAEQMNVDLLVVGSRSLGQVKQAFLGSVSDYCAHHMACLVLIEKPPKNSHHKNN